MIPYTTPFIKSTPEAVREANGTSTGVVKINGVDQTIPLNPSQDVATPFNHKWANAQTDYDGGNTDAFNVGNRIKNSSSHRLSYGTCG